MLSHFARSTFSPNKSAPATDVSADDYVDAGEEYIIYYSPEPDRQPDAIDYEAEDYVRHGNDADYEQRMVVRVLYNHSPPPGFYDRATDKEMEQERQYDLHCKEEYERLFLNCSTLGEVYPSDFGIKPDQTATAASNDHTRTTAQTATNAERAASVKAKRSTARATNGSDSAEHKLNSTAACSVGVRTLATDKTSIASRVHEISQRSERNYGLQGPQPCEQVLFPAVPYVLNYTVYDCCLENTEASFATHLDNWFHRYNQWAITHKQEPIYLDAYHGYGIKPTGPWEILELQVAVDMLRDYETLYHRFIYGMRAPPAVRNELYATATTDGCWKCATSSQPTSRAVTCVSLHASKSAALTKWRKSDRVTLHTR